MAIFQVEIRCTTVGRILVDAKTKEEAEVIAGEVSSASYKEEVEDTDYTVHHLVNYKDLTERIINCSPDVNADGCYYHK